MIDRRIYRDNRWGYILGIHSNIPECCVQFYLRHPDIVALNARRGLFADGVQYVMCTTCLRRYRSGQLVPAKIHLCSQASADPICRYYKTCPDRSYDQSAKSIAQRQLERALGHRIDWR